jgi:hypothetical protein
LVKLNGDCCITRALYPATSRDARDLGSCYESFDLCLFRWAEDGPEDIRGHESFACHSVVQRRRGAQRNSLGYMYRCLDRFWRSRVVGELEGGHLLEVVQGGEEVDCLWEVVADVMSRWYAEVVAIEVCANRARFAMLVFLLAAEYHVKEDASRKVVLEEEEEFFGRGVDLYGRNQNNHSEDRSCGHHQRPRPHRDPCQRFHLRGPGAWQHVSRGAFCGRARVTLRSVVDPQDEKEAGGF